MVNEKLLHFIWENSLIEAPTLFTADGEPLTILDKGKANPNAGPDFLDARVQIGSTLWAGHIEIHVHTKDWVHHGHSKDPKYQNVILHVVMFNDTELNMPTLELNGKIQQRLITEYHDLQQAQSWIACERTPLRLDSFSLYQFKNRLILERFERKLDLIRTDLEDTQNDWEECHYRNLLRVFGLKVNADGFNMLGQALPFKILRKHSDSILQVEALLFGVAGFLETPADAYQQNLQSEFLFLKAKHGLKTIPTSIWNFATLRPPNFPSLRIAQLASLVATNKISFAEVTKIQSHNKAVKYFKTTASPYWDDRYHFKNTTEKNKKKDIGLGTLELLCINHTIPMAYAFGWFNGDFALKERAIEWLENMKPERNQIISKWFNLGYAIDSAFDSQALIQLKNEYCNHKKCLSCAIGSSILRNLNPANEN